MRAIPHQWRHASRAHCPAHDMRDGPSSGAFRHDWGTVERATGKRQRLSLNLVTESKAWGAGLQSAALSSELGRSGPVSTSPEAR